MIRANVMKNKNGETLFDTKNYCLIISRVIICGIYKRKTSKIALF